MAGRRRSSAKIYAQFPQRLPVLEWLQVKKSRLLKKVLFARTNQIARNHVGSMARTTAWGGTWSGSFIELGGGSDYGNAAPQHWYTSVPIQHVDLSNV